MVRKNRMSTFPEVMNEILAAVQQGQHFDTVVSEKKYAVNLRHTFHRFRIAAVEEQVIGARLLTNMVCSIAPVEGSTAWSLHFENMQAVYGARPEDQVSEEEKERLIQEVYGRATLVPQASPEAKAMLEKGEDPYTKLAREIEARKEAELLDPSLAKHSHLWSSLSGACERCGIVREPGVSEECVPRPPEKLEIDL